MRHKRGHLQSVYVDVDRDDTCHPVLGHLQRITTTIHHQTVVLCGGVVDVRHIQGGSRAHAFPLDTQFMAHVEVRAHRVHVLRAVEVHRCGIHNRLVTGVKATQARVHVVRIDPCAVVAERAFQCLTRHIDGLLVGAARLFRYQLHVVVAVRVKIGT